MTTFTDALGRKWRLEFDYVMLDRIEQEAKVDLADLSAAGLLAVERDVKALGRVLFVACEGQFREQQVQPAGFQKQIRKEAISRSRKAVLEALADFFPESEWSEMLSSLAKLREQTDQISQLDKLAPVFNTLPDDVKRQLFQEEIEKRGNLPSSPDSKSVSDQDTTPPTPVYDSPENAESAPEDSPSETFG